MPSKRGAQKRMQAPEEPLTRRKRLLKELGISEDCDIWRECDVCMKQRLLSPDHVKLFTEEKFTCQSLGGASCDEESTYN